MAVKSKIKASWLQTTALRVTRMHFAYVAVYMVAIVIFDSWNLFTHSATSTRWMAAGTLLVVNTVLWYIGRIKFSGDSIYMMLILVLVLADIIFAALNVSWERGLASKAVALFSIPIITAGTLRSRSALLASASLSTAAYSMAVVHYFNQHYGESYRIELYGYIFFYGAVFFLLAWLLTIMVRPTQEDL